MTFMEKISTDMNNIMSSGKHIFGRPWDEEDCDYFFHVIFNDAVRNSKSSEELERAVIDFGITLNMMAMYFIDKGGESNDSF